MARHFIPSLNLQKERYTTTGEALLLGDAILLPTRIKLDKPRIEPASGTLDFWSDWSARPSDNEAIRLAVETLRRQTRIKDEAGG